MQQVEQRLLKIVKSGSPEIDLVGSYIFESTGKRMRPALFLLAAYHPGQKIESIIDIAVAFELIHTASLLHDDVIDQASVRRDKDSAHIRWSNKIAILTGDYLLSQAFKLLVEYRDWRINDLVVDMVQNMAEGEIAQAFASLDLPDLEERYFKWIGKKSASFFAGCCRAGSIVGDRTPAEQAAWSDFGYNLGIAFQLIDDLLDYTGESELTGKPLYSDFNNRIITLPLIRTINVHGDGDAVLKMFQDNTVSGSQLSGVMQTLLNSDGPDYTYRKAQEYTSKAYTIIDRLGSIDQDVKKTLNEMIEDVLNREC